MELSTRECLQHDISEPEHIRSLDLLTQTWYEQQNKPQSPKDFTHLSAIYISMHTLNGIYFNPSKVNISFCC